MDISKTLNDVNKYLVNITTSIPSRRYTIPKEYLDETIDVALNTRDITDCVIVAEKYYNEYHMSTLSSIRDIVEELTGFKCESTKLISKEYPNLSIILSCYCKKLKLNFYFNTLFKVPLGYEFTYYGIVKNGSYHRIYSERKAVYENIKEEYKVIEYELDDTLLTASYDELKSYISNVIREFVVRKPFVGGRIDPQFPQEYNSDEESDDTEDLCVNNDALRDILNDLIKRHK